MVYLVSDFPSAKVTTGQREVLTSGKVEAKQKSRKGIPVPASFIGPRGR
jgi:hypothetical protein